MPELKVRIRRGGRMFGWRIVARRVLSRRALVVAMCTTTLTLSSVSVAGEEAEDDKPVIDARQPRMTSDELERSFDGWVFGHSNDSARALAFLRSTLDRHLSEIDEVCGLRREQYTKLLLAGQADIKRLFDRVEEAKLRIRGVELPKLEEISRARVESSTLRQAVDAMLAQNFSMLEKVRASVLDIKQRSRYHAHERVSNVAIYRAAIYSALGKHLRCLELTDDQRSRLEQVIIDETIPPRSFCPNPGIIVLRKIGTISEDKIRPILKDLQWRHMCKLIEEIRIIDQLNAEDGFGPTVSPIPH